MPIYEYKCSACGEIFETIQKFSDTPLDVHENCGGKLERLVSVSALQFKGSGWYVNDYAKSGSSARSESGEKKPEGEKSDKSEKSSGTKSESSSDSSSSSSSNASGDSKPSESKTESKPAPAKSES